MLDKDVRNTDTFVASQEATESEQQNRDNRIRAILSQETYKEVCFKMTSFDVYCLDKLEGVMNEELGLLQRRWVDAAFDVSPC